MRYSTRSLPVSRSSSLGATSPDTAPAAPDLGAAAIILALAAIGYNAALAVINAHLMGIGFGAVAVTEALILAAGLLLCFLAGRRQVDGVALGVLTFFTIDALFVSLFSETIFVDMIRNAAIIAIFVMLGARLREGAVDQVFGAVSLAVSAVLIFEIVDVSGFARTFEPASYFEMTRGIPRFELDDLGLFRNAIGFEDRFSILKLVDHRTSSLFLEQVSLANFSTILCLYLVARWHSIGLRSRSLILFLTALILVTNNSRTGLLLAAVAPIVYRVAPRLPRLAAAACMPLALAIMVVVTRLSAPTHEDNFSGRLHTTFDTLAALDLPALLGMRAPDASLFADSGYTFVVYATSIFGLIAFWLFTALVLPAATSAQKRLSLFLNAYVAVNLLIGGTAIFSIKVAALMWLLVGVHWSAPSALPRARTAARLVPAIA